MFKTQQKNLAPPNDQKINWDRFKALKQKMYYLKVKCINELLLQLSGGYSTWIILNLFVWGGEIMLIYVPTI